MGWQYGTVQQNRNKMFSSTRHRRHSKSLCVAYQKTSFEFGYMVNQSETIKLWGVFPRKLVMTKKVRSGFREFSNPHFFLPGCKRFQIAKELLIPDCLGQGMHSHCRLTTRAVYFFKKWLKAVHLLLQPMHMSAGNYSSSLPRLSHPGTISAWLARAPPKTLRRHVSPFRDQPQDLHGVDYLT